MSASKGIAPKYSEILWAMSVAFCILFALPFTLAELMKVWISGILKTEISATKCGYFPIFRYNPDTKVFTLDSKNPDFSLYEESVKKK